MNNFDQLYLLLVLVSAGVAAIVTFLITRRQITDLSTQLIRLTDERLSLTRDHAAELDALIRERRQMEEKFGSAAQQKAQEEYERGRRQGELDCDQKAKAFSVVVRPFISQSKDGTIFKTNSLEIGYQYQLLVNGIPCFEPHIVIEQRTEEKEVNSELIEKLTQVAVNAAKKAVANTPAGKLITVFDGLVLNQK